MIRLPTEEKLPSRPDPGSSSLSTPIWFMDTSVFLRALLGDSPAAAEWINSQRRAGAEFYASRLLAVEAYRTVLNKTLLGMDDFGAAAVDSAIGMFSLVDVTDQILDDACVLRAVLRAADAIHVATALALGTVTLVTHDAQMAAAARTLGLAVTDPVTDDVGRPPVA